LRLLLTGAAAAECPSEVSSAALGARVTDLTATLDAQQAQTLAIPPRRIRNQERRAARVLIIPTTSRKP